MKKFILLLTSLFFLSCADSQFPIETLGPSDDPVTKAGTKCESQLSNGFGVNWNYCMHRYPDSGDRVLFYFHGLGGSEKSWESGSTEKQMLQYWRNRGIKPPLVISISFGQAWFLAEKNNSPASGLYNVFVNGVLPFFQQKLSPIAVSGTYLMGVSMGGFNAAQLYLKNSNLFTRVALICPAMSMVSPHASDQEIQNYIASTGADPELVVKSLYLAKQFFPTEADWQKHSPNILAPLKGGPSLPPVYVSNGMADLYGFYQGNSDFVNKLKAKGTPVASNFYVGAGHCSINPIAAADALMPF